MAEQLEGTEVPENEPLPEARKAKTVKRVKVKTDTMQVMMAKIDVLLEAQGISPLSVERELDEAN